ncbi:hypothetical protein KS4_13750 [Poriferisphaera corsica]|uniref:Uncharacterized protein n=1 Tax=Poriferisphaera corsica TaxID=2528020 RepID=A0A517YSX2_9BACT|nr:hypothetical protein [Poriferisphaera corsica]QDU33329.1 hypothetical protein KS4_13750 [Poriferisphaera corsica]
MSRFNWADAIQKKKSIDVMQGLKRTELYYWVGIVASVPFVVVGLAMMFVASDGDARQMIWGLFFAVMGFMEIMYMKLWAQVRIGMFMAVWDRQKWVEDEINKSESEDF